MKWETCIPVELEGGYDYEPREGDILYISPSLPGPGMSGVCVCDAPVMVLYSVLYIRRVTTRTSPAKGAYHVTSAMRQSGVAEH